MRRTAPALRRVSARFGVGLVIMASILASPDPVRGQESAGLALEVDEQTGSVQVVLGDILSGGGLRESLESGLPIRLELAVELWRDRFFDSLEGRDEWRGTVWYDPLAGSYRIESAESPIARSASLVDAMAVLRSQIDIDLQPDAPGSYYYLGRAEVETLSLSDLEELRRWLQGELGPAIEGDEEVEGALRRGISRLFVRALGLSARRLQARSPRFEWGD